MPHKRPTPDHLRPTPEQLQQKANRLNPQQHIVANLAGTWQENGADFSVTLAGHRADVFEVYGTLIDNGNLENLTFSETEIDSVDNAFAALEEVSIGEAYNIAKKADN